MEYAGKADGSVWSTQADTKYGNGGPCARCLLVSGPGCSGSAGQVALPEPGSDKLIRLLSHILKSLEANHLPRHKSKVGRATAMRRSHRKSRYGCRKCKQRHTKCDETRPSCTNCLYTQQQCSYLDTGASTLPAPPQQPPARQTPGLAGFIGLPTFLESASSGHGSLLGEQYSLLHLELLHLFEHKLSLATRTILLEAEPLFQLALSRAFATPYLMDEVLALSAAHKSTLLGQHENTYHVEATRLQTRSLTRFNAARADISEANCLTVFIFSTLLGQHALFDACHLSLLGDLAAVLDKLDQCLGLHRGICAIAAPSWPEIQSQLQLHLGATSAPAAPHKARTPADDDECAGLMTLLRGSELSEPALQVCCKAVQALQLLFDSQRSAGASGSQRLPAVQEWPVRVPVGYVDLLKQRRPEALVILAYYAVLLHHAKDFWAIGDTGRFLIRSITSHLGAYWADWLQWPNQVLDRSEPGL